MEAGAHNEKQALIYGLGAVTLWSTVATGFKLGLAVLAVEQLLLIGSVISWLVFLSYAVLTNSWRLRHGDYWLALGLGVINPFAYYMILFAAYERLPAHIAQPLNYTWAIALAILAVPILKQPLTLKTLAGIFISYGGVVLLLTTAADGTQGGWNVAGVVLALVSTLLWASYWLVNTRSRSDPAALMLWSFTAGIPLIALACWVGPGWPALNGSSLAYGAWVGLIEMGITFILWQRALRLTGNAARIGALIFLAPFLSLAMIYFVLQEQITGGAILGLAVIILGMFVARPPHSP